MAVKLLLVPPFCCFWMSVGTRVEAPPPREGQESNTSIITSSTQTMCCSSSFLAQFQTCLLKMLDLLRPTYQILLEQVKSGFVENLFAALQHFLLITANRSSGSSGEPFYHLSPSNNLTLIRNFRGTERPPPGSASHQDGAKTQTKKKTNSA